MNKDSYTKAQNNGNGQSCKKSKCCLFFLNQIKLLPTLIFKCDLNLGKMNAHSCSENWN